MNKTFYFSKGKYIKSRAFMAICICALLSMISLLVVYNRGVLDPMIGICIVSFFLLLSLSILLGKIKVKTKSKIVMNNGHIRYEDIKVDGYVSRLLIKRYKANIFYVDRIEDVTVSKKNIRIHGSITMHRVSGSEGNFVTRKKACNYVIIPRFYEPDQVLIENIKQYGRKSL